jgi:hypothetical protein
VLRRKLQTETIEAAKFKSDEVIALPALLYGGESWTVAKRRIQTLLM